MSLEVTESEQNDYLEVVLSKGRLQLVAGDAIYSWDDLYVNFTAAFRKIEVQHLPIQNVLLLGLGLGSVPYILEKEFELLFDYTAVEWDEEVAFLASKYSFPRLKSRIETHIGDAELFVEMCSERYDLICMDIFEDDLTPPQFETEEFLRSLATLLSKGGHLLYNRLYHTDDDKLLSDRFQKNVFEKVFPNASYADSSGNRVLIHKNR